MHEAKAACMHQQRIPAFMTTGSSAIEIREVEYHEFATTGRAVADYAFGKSPVERNVEELLQNERYYTHARALVAFADGEPQATTANHDMTQNIRGKVVRMGGVAGVASMPASRRRGIVRQIFEQTFRMQREMAMPVSALYPFRDSFYERMGYASIPQPRYLTVKPETLAPLVGLDKPGSCEQVAMKDGFEEWRAFLERIQQTTHGFSLKHVSNAVHWKDKNDWWLAFARDDGELVGAMTFQITGHTEKMIVGTFYTTSSIGRYQLLDWIGRHTDQVAEAQIELRPDDYPELWFRDLNAVISNHTTEAWPAPMGRVVDVSLLDGIGAGDGAIALEISDALCPWNNGAFTFSGSNGTLTVTPGGRPAATITIQGLSALVFRGHDPADFTFRGWGEPDEPAQEALRTLFPPIVPDMHETF